ncbi:hypothetical protein [Nafulsella turpanensis]|uniref:hypothetical protein n=1 Tax=Nafulsella turpanensis TaxID=1265690 RepID=UPI00034DB892|nr:hypothetical protein [Nafulsella turpanensis]
MKKCPVCQKEIIGRKDKVYCSLSCKSAQQYEQRQEQEAHFYKVDRQLKKNRTILKSYNKVGKTTLRKEVLLAEGFDPAFFTNYWKNSKGQVYLFCYEYGFLSLKEGEKEKYLLVTWQPYMNR